MLLFWIVIACVIFGLGIVLGDSLKAKSARERKLKNIANRLEQIKAKNAEDDTNQE